MTTAILPVFVTEEEYLTNPRYKHCEYVDGQVLPASLILDKDGCLLYPEAEAEVGNKRRSKIQFLLGFYLGEYLLAGSIGRGATELRCLLSVSGERMFRLPDLAVVLGDDELDEDRYFEGAPNLVVEIQSPDQSLLEQYQKIDEHLEAGAQLAWLIESGGIRRTLKLGESLEGGAVLPGFELLIDKLF